MNKQQLPCSLCNQLTASVFCSLEQQAVARLDAEKTVHRFSGGNVLFYEGAAPLAIYCIRNGLVKLTKAAKEGRSIAIRLLGKGEIAGFRAAVADEPYAATAEVVGAAEVCIIPAHTFRLLLQDSSEFKTTLIEKLATELRVSEERILDQVVLPGRARVARILLFLSDQMGLAEAHPIIETPLLRQDLAEVVGVTPQTFSRILHQLKVEGIIESSRSRIIIKSRRRLQAIAN